MTASPALRAIHILHVEDNLADVRLLQVAFSQCPVPVTVDAVSNGEAALVYLKRCGRFPDAKRPDLILLDWHLPGLDGGELLHELKRAPDLRRIPVVVLSGSVSPRALQDSYEFQASAYLEKPKSLDGLYDLASQLVGFWLYSVRSATPSAAHGESDT